MWGGGLVFCKKSVRKRGGGSFEKGGVGVGVKSP